MANEYLLGVDIGTYSSKGVLVNADTGDVVSSHVIEHNLSMPKPGWVEHDPEGIWWQEFVRICRSLLNESAIPAAEVKAVGVSGIGPCVLPVDAEGHPLRQAILYGIDTRAKLEIQQCEEALGREAIFKMSGSNLSSSSAGPKILWIKNNEPEVFERARWFLTCQSYLVLKLTGDVTIDAYSACSVAPFVDVENNAWLEGEILGVNPRTVLPRIIWTTDVAGHVTTRAAAETGLLPGTPVIGGTIDAAAEAISTGLTDEGDMMMMFGSSNSLILRTDHWVRSENFWGLNWLRPGTFALVGGMATLGSLTRWFRDNFSPEEVAAQAAGGPNAYAALGNLLNESSLGAKGLVALPYFGGERTPFYDPDASGVLFGLTLKHTRADVYRALLEGVGYGLRHNIDTLSAEGAVPRRVLGVGGATYNQAWMQIIADITKLKIEIPEKQHGASYGDAFLAGLGIGRFTALSDVNRWVKHNRAFIPSPENYARYTPFYQLFRELYQQTNQLMWKLSDLRRSL